MGLKDPDLAWGKHELLLILIHAGHTHAGPIKISQGDEHTATG